jgi:hypothetical protein
MRIVIFLLGITIGMVANAQGIYSPLKSEDVQKGEMYQDGVWYTDEYDGVFACYIGESKAEADAFLSELAKDLDIDLKAPFSKTRQSTLYKSAACPAMEVKWVKVTYGEQILIVRLYMD